MSSNILSDESYTFACYTYVDDTDLIHNGTDNNSKRIIPDMQRMLDHWAGGLRATGGTLVPAKSYWYGIDFKWNQKKLNWEYKSIAELPGSLILRDHLQQPTTIRRMEVTQAKGTLGLWIAADGNQITQMQVLLLLLVERWIDKICTKQLTKTEAWLSLRMGVAKSLRYPLTATCLSKKDCETLDKKLLAAALPALGFPPKYPHKIAQAPPEALDSVYHPYGMTKESIT
jgi:hypothetical protein